MGQRNRLRSKGLPMLALSKPKRPKGLNGSSPNRSCQVRVAFNDAFMGELQRLVNNTAQDGRGPPSEQGRRLGVWIAGFGVHSLEPQGSRSPAPWRGAVISSSPGEEPKKGRLHFSLPYFSSPSRLRFSTSAGGCVDQVKSTDKKSSMNRPKTA